ncbi:hypothetical protein SAMN05444166_0644 [Singulisphaera sp. GP187]|nr:hypothetical protein SAMN05444166_0644 [Singulisphaera sp. GP187]
MSDEASNTDEGFDADFDHRWALRETPGKWAPLFRLIHGIGAVDLIEHIL